MALSSPHHPLRCEGWMLRGKRRPKIIQEVFMESFIHKELSCKLVGMAYTVHNILGPGLLEHAYKEAMCVELKLSGIPFDRERVYPLEYKGENIGTYFADIVVDDKIILEIKSAQILHASMVSTPISIFRFSPI
jgi:GxxExxY protein